jgi:hypothetical protein
MSGISIYLTESFQRGDVNLRRNVSEDFASPRENILGLKYEEN